MSAVVAIDISDDLATLVAGTIGPQESITLLKVRTVPIDELFEEEAVGADSDTSQEPEEDSEGKDTGEVPLESKGKSEHVVDSSKLESILGIDIDSSVGVLSGREVLYRTYKLPFASKKKIIIEYSWCHRK